MAFHNTSERYQYIYGSSVRKLDEDCPAQDMSGKREYVRQRQEDRQPKNHLVHSKTARSRHVLLDFDWKYTIITILAIILCASAAIFYLRGTAQLRVMENKISGLKTEKTVLLGKQAALQAEIDKSINLDEIQTFASEKLHMVYPKDSKVVRYEGNSKDDYFRQYESVRAQK